MKKELIAALCLAGAAQAGAEDGVALTVYNQNFALVKDVRSLDLTRGVQEYRIDDVAATIDATSVHVKAIDHPDAVAVLEQNFRYDLAGADRLLSRYLNQEVSAILEDGTPVDGTLLSFDAGTLVLADEDGGAVILQRSRVRDVRLGTVPGGLVVKPTLVWTLASDRAGSERLEVSYLANAINWHAEYVAVVDRDSQALDLSGWVSLDNRSGATYENARLKLVAGDVHRAQDVRLMHMRAKGMESVAEASQFESDEFFEYHIYTLQRPATVADRETKQLSLFPTAESEAQKKLVYDGARYGQDVRVEIEFDNTEANGLGLPLPAGKIRVFQEDSDGALEFVGEDRVDHTPRDETVRVYVGNAFDVKGERTRTDYRKISNNTMEETFDMEIRNHKDESVRVVVVEHMRGDWRVLSETLPHEKKDSHTVEYLVDVPARESVTVTYRVRTRY